MGTWDNIGGTLLDVQQGMEYAKANQRRDADWERNQKRADMQDKVAGYGLADLERKRADEAGNREAFKTGGLSAVQTAAKERGDQEAYQKAAADRIAELTNSINQRELEAKQLMQPDALKLAQANLSGAVARAPAQNALASNEIQQRLRDLTEKQSLDMVMLAKYNKKAAIEAYNKSGLVEAGKEASDISYDDKKTAWVLTYKDGSTLDMPLQQIQAQYQKHYPPQYKTLNKGDSLVGIGKTGKPEIALTVPDSEHTKPLAVTDNTTGFYDPRTKTVTPVGIGGQNPKRQDARVQIARDHINKALGGSLNMGLSEPDAQKVYEKATALAETYIATGADPIAAANKAMDEVRRTIKLAGLSSGVAPAAPATKFDWKALLQSQ